MRQTSDNPLTELSQMFIQLADYAIWLTQNAIYLGKTAIFIKIVPIK